MKKNWQPSRGSVPLFLAEGKFNTVLSNHEIAQQIANLLNQNNRLAILHNQGTILSNKVQYYIEFYGQIVSGCVGLIRQQNNMDKIVHLSVIPQFRGKGIGKRLILTALNNSTRDIIYMQIREDNIASLKLAESLGFKSIAYIPKANYNLLSMCLFRRKGWPTNLKALTI